ncbi:hypothetical protein [Anaerostipes sp.]|uniref:hypothetical protein n=1 Tax=Anaerostipes sp. TaxID=1872530 RepID=UPI0025C228F2|nr:hypothetical protein [Anaerostipes sp.]MBS7008988.1 hypothetical protein [Anaerostipes sp.]
MTLVLKIPLGAPGNTEHDGAADTDRSLSLCMEREREGDGMDEEEFREKPGLGSEVFL